MLVAVEDGLVVVEESADDDADVTDVDVATTPSREEWEEAREMGRVAGGSLSEANEASRLSTRLHPT